MKARFIANLRMSRKLLLLSGVFVVGFLAFGGFAYYTISTIKVNGPIYREIILQKDLVADILPPPEYIIETYLTTLRLRDATSTDTVDTLTKKLQQLRKDFDERHTYWAANLPEGLLKDTLIKESYDTAILFFDTVDKELIPAARGSETDKATTIIDQKLTPLYETHRASIDKVVEMADKESQRIEGKAASVESRSMLFLIAVAAAILMLAIIFCIIIATGISRPMRNSVAFALKIAEGDFTQQLAVQQKDEVGMLADALNGMSTKLRDMVAAVQENAQQVASSSE
jgi:methyl-accepting chemotaxis protein